jgi:hypothetical protein
LDSIGVESNRKAYDLEKKIFRLFSKPQQAEISHEEGA